MYTCSASPNKHLACSCFRFHAVETTGDSQTVYWCVGAQVHMCTAMFKTPQEVTIQDTFLTSTCGIGESGTFFYPRSRSWRAKSAACIQGPKLKRVQP